MHIRPIEPGDKDRWLPLWRGYQAFYKVQIPDAVTNLTWSRFFDDGAPMHAFVAEDGPGLLGLVHYVFHASTWTEGPYVYLQDLFTAESARGRGVGRALIEAVYDAAKTAKAARVYWLTHETNTTAMALYDKVADKSGFIQYRKTFQAGARSRA